MRLPALETAWRSAWRPPERYTPSEWSERNRVLPPSVSAEPGRYSLARTPYARGIMDAVVERTVEEIWFVAGTQIGKTTIQENVLGYWIDNDPGPCLIVKPSEAAVEESVKERWRPLLETSPSLRRHTSPRPHDNTLSSIKLDTMPIYFGWAGSPQSLASRPCRYVLPDECDKFPPFAGREADPISLARERTATYGHRRRLVAVSTPTTRDGAIWKGFEACGDKRYFHVPCPHCGTYQRLVWPQVKWPKLDIADKIKRADEIERCQLAWYECAAPACKARIEESHKPKMLERGIWASEGQTVDNDGTLRGERPASKRVGFHLSSLYSPWRKFCEMAAEWIRADGDVAATMNFRNSRLAEPFEVQISKTEANTIRQKATGGPAPKTVQAWARVLVATADTQKDHFYYTVRAWGYEYRSQLVDYGIVSTFDELRSLALDTPFPLSAGGYATPAILLIDSGGGKNADTGSTRTSEVYEFAMSDPGRIKPIKGASGKLNWPVDKSLQKSLGLVLWNVDTDQCKDHLNRLIHDPDATRWVPHSLVNDVYCSQMASEHKVVDPQTKRQEWKPKTSGAANHFWDCEVYQCAAAWELGLGNPEPPAHTNEPAPARSSERASPLSYKGRW